MLLTISKLSLLAAVALQGVYAAQNQLVQVTGNIGPNPNNVGMYVYRPSRVATSPALIVAIHYCTGTAQAYFSGTQYANLADTNGFIVVYPNSPRSGGCFDVNTNQTLTHNGGGDSQGIASMISYAISNYGVNPSKVFVTGTSSGAMMTNVMAGSYPNLIAATSIYSGVPFACFAGPSDWNSACALGQISKTAAQWGDLVRAAYPGYTGARPKMMIWHGTADTTLYYNNFGESVKEWTNVLGDSQTPATTTQNDPSSGYTHTSYGNGNVQAYSAANVGHTVPVHEAIDLAWFGIAGSYNSGGGSGGGGGGSSTTTSPPSNPTGGSVPHWGQCGGIGYTGPTACAAPYTCTVANAYYSQCL